MAAWETEASLKPLKHRQKWKKTKRNTLEVEGSEKLFVCFDTQHLLERPETDWEAQCDTMATVQQQ